MRKPKPRLIATESVDYFNRATIMGVREKDDFSDRYGEPAPGLTRIYVSKPAPFKHREGGGLITSIDIGLSSLPGYVTVHFVSEDDFRMELDIHHEEAPAIFAAEERLGPLDGYSSGINIRTMAGLAVNEGKRATRVGSILLGVTGPTSRLEVFAPPILSGSNADEIPRLMASNMMYGDMRKLVAGLSKVIRKNEEQLAQYPSRIVLPETASLLELREAAAVSNVSLDKLQSARQPKLPQRQAAIAEGYARFMSALASKRASRSAANLSALAQVPRSEITHPPTSVQSAPRLLFSLPPTKATIRGVDREVHGILFDVKNVPLVALFNENNEVVSYTKLSPANFQALRDGIADGMVPLNKEGGTSIALPLEMRADMLLQLSNLLSQVSQNRESLKEVLDPAKAIHLGAPQRELFAYSDLPNTRSGTAKCADGHFEAQQKMAEIDSALAAQPFKSTPSAVKAPAMR